MWKVLFRARNRFARDQRGNVAILFAFSMVPLIGLLGGAVDLTRHQRHKAEILNAMDSAAIALARRGAKDDAAADDFVNSYIAPMLAQQSRDKMLHLARFDATAIAGGYRVTGRGVMDTAFLPVVGIREMPIDLQTEVMMTGGKYEVALALDNTGSMARHGRIQALRDAASQLVDDLYREEGTSDRVKMALVPFVTAVNIKAESAFDWSWIDPVGSADYYHVNFSKPSNRLDLFAAMGGEWKGCVEARAEEDEEDTLPVSDATRWVPYLWPDEPDVGNYDNSYLTDSGTANARDRLTDVEKYFSVPRGRHVADTTSMGPNAACPRAIVPLTNDTELMKREIRLMKPHNESGGNNSGTNVAQGLVWAWRVLSNDAPFEEGAPYEDEETTKVLVLLSDGRNQVVSGGRTETRITQSDYNSFGYLADGRLGYTRGVDFERAEETVDEKVARVCENVKAKGIRLYTILFQVDFEKTQDLFRACASTGRDGEPLYYYVPDASALETAFRDIGEDLTTLRITR